MDNNNQPTSVQTPAPQADPTIVQTSPVKKGSMIPWIIAIFVVLLVAGGTYYYMQQNKADELTASPTPSPTTAPTDQEDLDEQLNNIDVSSDSAEFKEVDSDLQNL